MLVVLCILVGSYIGYFYSGTDLGPRYLFEDLPFLLILTARGIVTLGACGSATGQMIHKWISTRTNITRSPFRSGISKTTGMLVAGLVLCNLLYFLPRQIAVYQDYTAAGFQYHNLNVSVIYYPPIHHAIVVTDDKMLYQNMLFGLNDALLLGDVIYAQASDQSAYKALHLAFPARHLYRLDIAPNGAVRYVALTKFS